jgi:hypothetical protein
MMKSFTKNMNFKYVPFLFLVLLLSISLAACGSTTVEDLNNIVTPPVDSPSYEISGFGVIKDPGSFFGISLTLVNVRATGGEFYFNDDEERLDFRSTEITSISASTGSATVIANGEFQQLNGTYEGGYTFEITIIDDVQDKFSITIKDADSTEIYTSGSQPINIVEGDFSIAII